MEVKAKMGDTENKGDDKGTVEQVSFSKGDHEALLGKAGQVDKLSQDLEDLRMEVFTPEYSAFLDSSKVKGDDTKGKDASDKTLNDDEFEKMSKKDLFVRAKEAAKEELKAELQRVKDERTTEVKEAT